MDQAIDYKPSHPHHIQFNLGTNPGQLKHLTIGSPDEDENRQHISEQDANAHTEKVLNTTIGGGPLFLDTPIPSSISELTKLQEDPAQVTFHADIRLPEYQALYTACNEEYEGDPEYFDLMAYTENLGLPPLKCFVFASSMISSAVNPRLSSQAIMVLNTYWARAVKALGNPSSADLSPDTSSNLLHHLLVSIRDEYILDERQRLQLLLAIDARHGRDAGIAIIRTVLHSMKLPIDTTFIQALNQLGPGISSDRGTVLAMLHRFGLLSKGRLSTGLARNMISELLDWAPRSKLLCDFPTLVRTLCEVPEASLDWAQVVLPFDRSRPSFIDRATLSLLKTILLDTPRHGSSSAISGFWTTWDHPHRQLQLLDALLSLPRETFNLTQLPGRRIVDVDDLNSAPGVSRPALVNLPQDPWNSLDIMELLVQIGESQSLPARHLATKMLERVCINRPELLLLGLMQMKTNVGLHRRLSENLTQFFLSGHLRDDFALAGVYRYRPDLLAESFLEFYLKDSNNLQRILDIAHYIKVLPWLLDLALPDEFLLRLAVLGSSYDLVDLGEWLAGRVAKFSVPFYGSMLTFAAASLRDGSLHMSGASIFLTILETNHTFLTKDDDQLYRDVFRECCLSFPELLPFFPVPHGSAPWQHHPIPDDIESRVNATYKQLLENELSVGQALRLLQIQRSSHTSRDRRLFEGFLQMMYRNLLSLAFGFESEEGEKIATLLGLLINNELLESFALEIALHVIQESLQEPASRKSSWFGLAAVFEITDKLHLWPKLLASVTDLVNRTVIPGHGMAVGRLLAVVKPSSVVSKDDGARTKRHSVVLTDSNTEGSNSPSQLPESQYPVVLWSTIQNLVPDNLPTLVAETSFVLQPSMINRFAQDILKGALSTNLHHHELWLLFLDLLENDALTLAISQKAISQVKEKLLAAVDSHSSVGVQELSNIGSWLGLSTLSRGDDRLAQSIDLKQVLVKGHFTNSLDQILPCVCSLLRHCKGWNTYQQTWDWLQNTLSFLIELYHFADLQTSSRAEIDALAEAIGLEITKFSTSSKLTGASHGRAQFPSPEATEINTSAGSTESSEISLAFSSLSLLSDGSSSSSMSMSLSSEISGSVSLLHEDPIGCGGFCDLYVGHYDGYGKVALKRPRFAHYEASTIRRFCREADLWCRISHPNILPFLGTCMIRRNVYMVSPFIESGDLLHCLRNNHRVDRPKVLRQVGDALAHLHSLDIVHGDIKAQNVLVSDQGSALLCDFGLAKALNSMETSTEVKGRGSTRWMAPELFTGGNKTTESDVYGFGMTIVEVLTGEPPFAHLPNNHAVMYEVVVNGTRPPKQPPESDDGTSLHSFWEIAEKCWATQIKERPTMKEVSAMLAVATA